MHDIWNPWHGCIKKSEGCDHCYMYFLDKLRDQKGSNIYRTKAGFNNPVQKDRSGNYKIKSGEQIRVCMTSDFFLAEADEWRDEAWKLMKIRSDVIFFLLTKRPERVAECSSAATAAATAKSAKSKKTAAVFTLKHFYNTYAYFHT